VFIEGWQGGDGMRVQGKRMKWRWKDSRGYRDINVDICIDKESDI
jgi:hypothetical protein